MLSYILKRIASSLLVILGSSVLVFVLVINSGDPLQELRQSNAENRDYLIQQRIEYMNLDQPWYGRYWTWLSGVAGCLRGACSFGTNINGQDVGVLIQQTAAASLRMVFLATVLSIIIGVLTGILSAIRQYSTFDYAVSFVIFLFFSLPIFWAAVLAKEWMAIRFNDWILDPRFSILQILVTAGIAAVVVPGIIGGGARRRVATGAATGVFVVGAMLAADWLNYARQPQLGPLAITLLGAVVACGLTALIAGMGNRRVLWCALGVVGLGLVSYYATFWLMLDPPGGWWTILGLLGVTVLVSVLLARIFGGHARGQATAVSVLTGLIYAGLVLLDHIMRQWPGFLQLKPRPISTIGSQTPNFDGGFWDVALDQGTQLILPTTLLMLVSVATYTRYTRNSMLEVTGQDYIRTARAKGVNERTVILKHAFRNSLIPITTIVAFDFAGLIGGSVVLERVFGWNGIGELFTRSLEAADPAPVMGFFLVTGVAAVLFNLTADIMYAVLDPRIRV